MKNRISRIAAAAVSALIMATGIAMGQEDGFPRHPIKIVVPYAPGGTTDTAARTIADALGASLSIAVIVENRAGAGGTIGSAYVAHAVPDGYTLLFSDVGPITISRNFYDNLSYDPLKDLAPVSVAVNSYLNLTVPADSPAKNVQEFIELARSKPGTITYGSSGVGTILHLAAELFAKQAGIKLVHIPYQGGSPALTAVLSGEVAAGFNQLAPSLPLVKSGKIRSLGVTSTAVLKLAPDIPTIKSQGMPDYEFGSWQGLFVPGGTSPELVEFLNNKVVEVLKSEETVKRLNAQGFEVVSNSPAEFKKLVLGDADKWERLIKEQNIKPN